MPSSKTTTLCILTLFRGRKSSRFNCCRRFHESPRILSPATDFRSFIDILREDGDLVDIHHEVDPHLEVGAIARRVSERNSKVPLFHNVRGARQGLWKMTSNLQSLRQSPEHRCGRIALGLGLPANAQWKEINDKVRRANYTKPPTSKILETGACKENKLFGDDIDLTELPAPLLHQNDGGKYVQTYGMHILQSPDGSWTNWSISRAMVNDKRKLVGLCIPPQHNWQIREMWKKEGKDVPWALALGVPPAAIIAAALPIPDRVSELDYVNALTGVPMNLVKCETNNLLVPATSEIIFEGTLSTTETAPEGPFGEYLAHSFKQESRQCPVYNVNAITYRNGAILPVSVPGKLTDESHVTAGMIAPGILDICLENKLPIVDAFSPLETYATWVVLKVDSERLKAEQTTSRDLCEKIGNAVFRDKRSFLTSRLVLVGGDIDIYDFKEVMWAFACRCRPGKDEYIFDDVPGLPLVPFMSNTPRPCRGGKTVSDCLLDAEYTQAGRNWEKADFEHEYPKDTQRKVLAQWENMGLD
ncbi:cytoplasm protein [Aspergillus sclerotialis]|uniref:Ferulic acid decarboxylase 1 n=1 Tax=Aspergillus sclerotialis TaxID=2070753 RepID=A0A3A3A7M9_9EURO|nr:cytoplasm protein [Aspergillus sclerotialis]